jgi:hypothetical protein
MIASESTAFTLGRRERFSCNALQEALDSRRSDHAERRSDFDVIIIGGSVLRLPIDCTTVISIQRMQKKQPIPHSHHATHN